jgi:excisionase family DNA binding protein
MSDTVKSLYVDVVEAAAVLAVSPFVVRRLLRGGALIGYRFGREYRIKRVDLDSYVQSARTV